MGTYRLPSALWYGVIGGLLGWALPMAGWAVERPASPLFEREPGAIAQAPAATPPTEQAPLATQASQFFSQGVQQFQTRQYEAALASWQRAVELYERVGNRRQQGRLLGNIGAVYEKLGNPAQARAYYERSLEIADAIGDIAGQSYALGNLGNLLSDQGDYGAAIEIHQRARSLAQAQGNRQDESYSLNSLGIAYQAQGKYNEAITQFELALAIARDLRDREREAEVLGNLGNVAAERGEYREALSFYEQCLHIMEALRNQRGESIVRQRLGNVYLDLGNLNAANRYYEESLALARVVRDRRLEAYNLGNLGAVARRRENYELALRYYDQALVGLRQIGDRPREAVLRTQLGNTYLEQGDYSQAQQNFEQSLAIAQAVGDRQAESIALGNLGLVDDVTGKVDRALERYNQSLAIAQALGDRLRQGQALNNLGALYYYRVRDLEKAADALFRAVEIWESMRPGLSDENQISLFETQAHTYRLLQKVLIDLNRPNDALEISERGRARAFIELVATRLSASLATRFQTEPLTVEKIQSVARQQNATLVEYSVVDENQLVIWVIQPDGQIHLRLSRLNDVEVSIGAAAEATRVAAALGRSPRRTRGIEQQVRGLQETITENSQSDETNSAGAKEAIAPASPDPSSVRLNPQLQEFHRLLIQPIADLLPTDPNQQVVIIPHESLFLVPFAALQDEQGTFLIQKHTLRSAPAIQLLSLTPSRPSSSPSNDRRERAASSIVVGNPVMPRVGNSPQPLAPLPYSEQEAREIAALLNTNPLIGAAATEPYITRQLPTARVIHLATHGLLNDVVELGIPGAIALAPTRGSDGLLSAGEILNLSLQADLVVLSACNTGRGRITGDGVVGLSRAFLSAGAESVLVSLWAVPDAPTATLMKEFYQSLQRGQSRAQALRQAMIAMLHEYPNSRDWAAFVLVGMDDAL